MVSQITVGYPTDRHGHPFRRRRYLPFVATVVVLAIVTLVVWVSALSDDSESTVSASCNPPASSQGATPTPAAAARSTVAPSDFADVAPAALSSFQVRVLNASAQRGQARAVVDDLTAQGFTPATDAPYADDTVYAQDLNCVGQIRFGPGGRAAAAAVWLAVPCAQLVDDGRQGAAVDLALGTQYQSREQTQDQQAALEALRQADPSNPRTGADPSLVRAVHGTTC